MDPWTTSGHVNTLFVIILGVLSTRAKTDPEKGLALSHEKRLTQELLRRYKVIGKSGRPVRDSHKPVTVEMGFGLKNMDLDEKNKVLTLSMWTRYCWQDQYLTWDPEDYGSWSSVTLASSDIWIPDIRLHNTADVRPPMRDSLLVVRSAGFVYWTPHTIYRSTCSVDVANFPFDIQKCSMLFGSWSHNVRELNLTMLFPGGMDTSVLEEETQASSTWELEKFMSERREADGLVSLYFELHLKRRMVFSAYILTLPCVFLSSLTLVVFWLPPERPDRTALAMSLFASFMVLLLILVEAAPPTASSIPTLGIYYCFNMVIIMCSIILSSVVVNVARGGSSGNRVPKWLAVLAFSGLGRIFCIRKPKGPRKLSSKGPKRSSTRDAEDAPLTDDSNHVDQRVQLTAANINVPAVLNGIKPVLENIQQGVREASRGLQRIDSILNLKLAQEREISRSRKEWRAVAMCLDRTFFVLYLLINVVSLAVFFPRPSH